MGPRCQWLGPLTAPVGILSGDGRCPCRLSVILLVEGFSLILGRGWRQPRRRGGRKRGVWGGFSLGNTLWGRVGGEGRRVP